MHTKIHKVIKMEKEYKETEHIEQIIREDHRLLPIIKNFGFQLGFRNLSIKEACIQYNIDIPVFLSVINFIHLQPKEPFIGPYPKAAKKLYTLYHYLQCSLNSILQYRLPHVRRKLIEATDYSGRNQTSYIFLKTFLSLSILIKQYSIFETTEIQAYIEYLLQNHFLSQNQNIGKLMPKQKIYQKKIQEKITDLIQIIIKDYDNKKNNQLMNETLLQLFTLEEEFKYHYLIEEKLFLPCIQQIEESNSIQIKILQKRKGKDSNTKFCQLSEREKQVIHLVTQGLSNRQIAEKLLISINTVLTHRRHINKKLKIHSPTELTLHALSNGLISINELNMNHQDNTKKGDSI